MMFVSFGASKTTKPKDYKMKIALSVKIDVAKIDKARLFRGAKGTYLDCTVFVDVDNKGEFGDNGMITQDVKKEERQSGVKGAILGNATVFWRDDSPPQPQKTLPKTGHDNVAAEDFDNSFDDDMPF